MATAFRAASAYLQAHWVDITLHALAGVAVETPFPRQVVHYWQEDEEAALVVRQADVAHAN